FIGLYDVKTRTVSYVAPSTDRDTSPTWSPDGKRIAFLRRPGLPFGAQATPGAGSGLPDNGAAGGRGGGGGRGAQPPAAAPANPPAAPAAAAPDAAGRQGGRGHGGRAGGGGGQAAPAGAPPAPAVSQELRGQPGLFTAEFAGGYTLSLMVADLSD